MPLCEDGAILMGLPGAFTAEAQSEPANAALVQGQNIVESCDKM